MLGPIAIGGVGGSGTRAVAEVVQRLGVFIGNHLNGSNDNMRYPGLKRYVGTEERPMPFITSDEMTTFASDMERSWILDGRAPLWGWKNPPTFMSLQVFAEFFPQLRYIHVLRHGLDVAFSANHNQVQRWGHLFGIQYGTPSKARSALQYWIAANTFAIDQANRSLSDRFLVVSFDELVESPISQVCRIADFIGTGADPDTIAVAADRISPPISIGRYRDLTDAEAFSATEMASVENFGFAVW